LLNLKIKKGRTYEYKLNILFDNRGKVIFHKDSIKIIDKQFNYVKIKM